MENQPTTDRFSSTSLDYLNVVYSLLKRFPDLEHDEALSIGCEAIIRARKTFIRLHGQGDDYSYVYASVQNAFRRICKQKGRDNSVNISLEKFVNASEGREEVFCDPYNAYENWEFCEQLMPFIKGLNRADKVIFLFRWAHPDMSLKQTAQILSSFYPHLRLPKKQSGLTKRLQKLRASYNAYMSGDEP